MNRLLKISPLVTLLVVTACTTIPRGPSITSLPGTGKSFDEFRVDDASCRQYANSQIDGVSPNQAGANSGITSAAVGTVVGAVAGAAINGGRGASVGAGAGLLIGSAAGANSAEHTGRAYQRRYDAAYQQCMYAKGNKVPVSGQLSSRPAPVYSPPPPPRPPEYYGPPPPPSGYPPPPPPPRY